VIELFSSFIKTFVVKRKKDKKDKKNFKKSLDMLKNIAMALQ